MKIKSIFAVVLLALAVNVSAQVGIQAGYVNVTDKFTNTSSEVNGFNFGPVGEFGLVKNLDLRYGFLYTLLADSKEGLLSTTTTYTGHFVDVPVQAQFSFPVNNLIKVFAFGGPTLNLGLAQTTVTKGGSVEVSVNHYEANDKLSRFDVKLGLGAGVRFSNFEVRAGYDWGMLDLDGRDNLTQHRNQLTAALVYHL